MCSSPNPTVTFALLALLVGLRAILGTWLMWFRYDWLISNCNPPSPGVSLILLFALGNPSVPRDRTYVKFTLILGWIVFLVFVCGFVVGLVRC